MDSAVNAKMRAVSWEYRVWNVATPSGSVRCAGTGPRRLAGHHRVLCPVVTVLPPG